MEFGILGPLEVRDGERILAVGGAKQRALLALLVLHANQVVSSDRLLDELWGEEPPGSGTTALQVGVSRLRQALGAGGRQLVTQSPGYVLRLEHGQLDLHRFEQLLANAEGAEPRLASSQLREALDLWRGRALADFAYEAFAQAAVARLEELRLVALERRIEADLALGRHAALVGEVEALVAEHPLRERLRGQLMLAFYRSGRQTEALEVYQATRRTLVEKLGIEPSPALQALEKAILRQDPELSLAALATPERSILVALREQAALDSLLSLAEPLARHPSRELILTRLLGDADELGPASAALQERSSALIAGGVSARAAAFVSQTPAQDIVRLSAEQDVDLVLLDGSPGLLSDAVLEGVLAEAPCDIAVLLGEQTLPGPVLVPFVGAEHDWTAVELAAWLAGALGVTLQLAGPREGPGGRDASRLLASASLAVQRALGVAAEPLLIDPGSAGLLAAAHDAGLVVVGLSDRWQKQGLGPVRQALAAQAEAPVVLVRRGLRPGGLAPPASLTRFTWSLKPA